uniref:Aminotransferase-like plant mobile domain-containing protein n=1 Tax=Oryza rufipogon TaxID=4529 RepID=A0A0E0QGW2_ORYRU
MPSNPTQREIDWHSRALVLEILGSIIFTDSSGDSVPAMYLQFMDNLATRTEYNWGGAVLAMLYRQLNNGAEKARSEIFGPLVLLQLWSWSRLPLGRPKNIIQKTDEVEEQEKKESDGYPIFGAKWWLQEKHQLHCILVKERQVIQKVLSKWLIGLVLRGLLCSKRTLQVRKTIYSVGYNFVELLELYVLHIC